MVLFILLCFVFPLYATTLNVSNTIYGVNGVTVFYKNKTLNAIDASELIVYFGNNSEMFLPAFCVDLDTKLFYGNNTVDEIVTTTSYNPAGGLFAEWLMDSFSVQLGYRNTTFDNEDKWWNRQGAGLQLAIWEALYGDEFSYKTDTVEANVNNWYDFFISKLNAEQSKSGGFTYTSSGKYAVVKLSDGNGDTQDLITVVPEPATMLLFGFGLLGIGALGRRKE